MKVSGEDVGDSYARRIQYFPTSGRVLMLRLKRIDHSAVVNREKQYLSNLRETPAGNDVELF